MKDQPDIGKAIRFVRLSLGIDQTTLCNISHVSDSYLSMIENGLRKPSLETIKRLADAMNVSLTLLFMLVERKHPFVKPILPLAYCELASINLEGDNE